MPLITDESQSQSQSQRQRARPGIGLGNAASANPPDNAPEGNNAPDDSLRLRARGTDPATLICARLSFQFMENHAEPENVRIG